MNILKGIWNFVNSKIFLIIIVIVAILFFGRSCVQNGDLKRQAMLNDQNLSALTDTIRTERTKSGKLGSSIAVHILSEKELKKINEALFNDVQDQKGKVLSLNRANIGLKQDKETLAKLLSEAESSNGPTQQVNDSTFRLPWALTYRYDSANFDSFVGKTEIFVNYNDGTIGVRPSRTWMESRVSQIELTFGQRVEDDKLRVFVQSPYPGFTTGSLEGVLIDPNDNPYIKSLIKPKRWFTGLKIGIGVTTGFNVVTGTYGLVIGPTLIFSVYKLGK